MRSEGANRRLPAGLFHALFARGRYSKRDCPRCFIFPFRRALISDDSLNRVFLRCVVRLLLPGLFAWLNGASPAFSYGPTTSVNPAGETAVSIEKVEVGFRGWSKVGEWTPVWATLSSSADRQVTIVVDAPDPDDNLASYSSHSVAMTAGVPARFEACVRSGRTNGELLVRVVDAQGHLLASRRVSPGQDPDTAYRPALKLVTPLWITVGKLDLAVADADGEGSAASSNPRVVALDSVNELPTHWQSLQSVEMLILPTGRLVGGGQSRLAQISAERDAVLRNWVRQGGHLLVSVAGEEVEEFKQSLLAAWQIPVTVEGQFPLRQLSSLESFSGLNAPLRISGAISAAKFVNADFSNVLVRDSGSSHPLVASIPFGFGRVTLVGLDLEAPPLAGWPGLKSVLQRVAGTETGAPTRGGARKANRQLSHVGVSDLATQFQQTHEDFSAVERPSYWSVMGLILLYVAVIGPLDYFLVHRVLRRPELTWFSFALLAAGAVGLAAWSAGRINGGGLQVNQLNLVDVDAAGGTTRNTTWTSLYSAEHRRYSVAVEPGGEIDTTKASPAAELAWLAAPENSVGGLYRSSAAVFGGRGYRFSADAASVENLPVEHWSTKSLSATWSGELSKPLVECHLENLGTGQLRGSLTLHFNEPLEECMLVANGWAYLPTTAEATLKPGVEWQLRGDRGVRQRDLKALLTGEKQTRHKKDETSKASTAEITTTIEPYQPLGRNRGQQVRILTFHEATGGSAYTGLTNAALRNLELTDLMQLGRAVLVGRIATSPARVVIDGQPVTPASQATWVRLVLPVVAKERILDKTIPKASEKKIDSHSSAGGKP